MRELPPLWDKLVVFRVQSSAGINPEWMPAFMPFRVLVPFRLFAAVMSLEILRKIVYLLNIYHYDATYTD